MWWTSVHRRAEESGVIDDSAFRTTLVRALVVRSGGGRGGFGFRDTERLVERCSSELS